MNNLITEAHNIVKLCPLKFPDSGRFFDNFVKDFQKEFAPIVFTLAIDSENPNESRSSCIACTYSRNTPEGIFFNVTKHGRLTGYINGVEFRNAVLFFKNREMFEKTSSMTDGEAKKSEVVKSVLFILTPNEHTLLVGPAAEFI